MVFEFSLSFLVLWGSGSSSSRGGSSSGIRGLSVVVWGMVVRGWGRLRELCVWKVWLR